MQWRRARALGAAVAMATAATLSGCSAQPGAAAVVEGREITQSRLQQTQEDLQRLLPDVEPRTVLVALVVAPYFIEAAAENGVGVSEAQARTYLEQGAEQSGLDPVPSFGEGAVEVIQFSLASQALQGLPNAAEVIGEVETQVFGADIDVNPRYGTLDPATGVITPPALPWITLPQTG